jgi:two-component system response regulator GlrR
VCSWLEDEGFAEIVPRDHLAVDADFGVERRVAGQAEREQHDVGREHWESPARGLDHVLAPGVVFPERRRPAVRVVRRRVPPEALVTGADAVFDGSRVSHCADAKKLLQGLCQPRPLLVTQCLGEERTRRRQIVGLSVLRPRASRGVKRPAHCSAHCREGDPPIPDRHPCVSVPPAGGKGKSGTMSPPMTPDESRGGTEVHEGVTLGPVAAIPRLTAVSGPGAGRAFAMARSLATVGRHKTNDLVLEDPRVSGVHLELRRIGARVHARDAGSTNGTWLGDHRVIEIELAVGAELTIGTTLLRLDVDEDAAGATLSASDSFGELVGQSTVMRELFATLERIAPKNLTVLVQGETGTGKEEVARAIHMLSPRAAAPFVVIDATALPESLAESLLFGHEKGAFTGADQRRIGLFEAADGGTVFLDEIGDLPAPIQAKFLRVLERREVTRVGGTTPAKIDVRVVAATHRDLRHEIDAGRFREDLYFRLAQMRVVLPPLRDRPEDIPVLCQRLLRRAGAAEDAHPLIDPGALEQLKAQPWPGNVRELRNVLERASALATDGTIRRADVAGEGFGFRGTRVERSALDLGGTFAAAKERAMDRFESAYLAALVKHAGGNLSLAARRANVARHHLRDLLKKRGLYGISWLDEKANE